MLLTVEESQIRESGNGSPEQLRNNSKRTSALDAMLPHSDTHCDGTGDAAGALQEVDGYVARNRKLLGNAYCAPELREETPGREETRTDPPDGQQDPESGKNKEKNLGI